MTYTTQQLQAMSDFEVNKALCLKLGYDVSGINEQRNMMTGAVIDYCNNPSEIMPLAFERGISVNSSVNFDFANNDDEWVASEYIQAIFTHEGIGKTIKCSEKWFSDTNPLRAIACLLLMRDE